MTTTDPFTPAIVRVQRDASDRDAKLGAAILELWDLLVRVLDLSDGEQVTDPEAIAELRAQLAATSRHEWADRKRAEMDAAHAAARKQAGTPPGRRYDGSRAPQIQDETDLVMERQRALGRQSQAAKHAAMGAKRAESSRRDTRAIREEIYRRMPEKSGQ
jgi:hypothetical protein